MSGESAPRPRSVRVTLEFPDGTKHGGLYSISTVPDIDRTAHRVRNTIAQKLDIAPAIPEITE